CTRWLSKPVFNLRILSCFPSFRIYRETLSRFSCAASVYKYEIFNEKGELATTGSTELICIKEDTFKPIRLDRYFPDWHEAYSKVQTLNNEGKTVEIMDGIDSL
ncbi:hypothetical protein ACT6QD_09085, partial [Staphylococcus aureus]